MQTPLLPDPSALTRTRRSAWAGRQAALLTGAILSWGLAPLNSHAQVFTIGDANVAPGGVVNLPVSVQGFTDIGTLQFSLAWDSSVLQLRNSATPPAVSADAVDGFTLNGLSLGNFSNPQSDRLVLSWDSPSGTGVSMANGPFFTLHFNAVGAGGSQSTVRFTDDPAPREISSGQGADITADATFNPGTVTITAVPEPASASFAAAACLLVGAAVRCLSGTRSRKVAG